MSTHLRAPGRPVRVAELLWPTVLTLATRGRVSAENFLTLLAPPSESPTPNPEEPPR